MKACIKELARLCLSECIDQNIHSTQMQQLLLGHSLVMEKDLTISVELIAVEKKELYLNAPVVKPVTIPVRKVVMLGLDVMVRFYCFTHLILR